MTQIEIYQKIALAVNDAAKSKNPRLTLAVEGELGCAYFLHINAVSAEVKPYAQYNEALTICFKKRGGRMVYGVRFYGTKPIAIFSGWQETSWKQPGSFFASTKTCFIPSQTASRRSRRLPRNPSAFTCRSCKTKRRSTRSCLIFAMPQPLNLPKI